MTLEQYITKEYSELKKITNNITKNNDLTEDLFHYCLEILLNYDKAKMGEILKNNHVKYFYVSVVMKQWCSSTSPFYKEYRKAAYNNTEYMDFHDIVEEEYNHEIDEKIAFIQEQLKDEHWYVQKVIQMKADMSYGDINKITKIPRSSLYGTVDKFRQKVISKYERK
jgi:hypothetical protein